MPRLRLPVFGSRVVTQGRVMKRPASCGQHCRMGKSRSEKLSRLITSLQGPVGTVLGKEFSGFGEEREHFQFVEEALRGFDVEKHFDAVGEFVEGIHAQG
jgi:hypothetical protein